MAIVVKFLKFYHLRKTIANPGKTKIRDHPALLHGTVGLNEGFLETLRCNSLPFDLEISKNDEQVSLHPFFSKHIKIILSTIKFPGFIIDFPIIPKPFNCENGSQKDREEIKNPHD